MLLRLRSGLAGASTVWLGLGLLCWPFPLFQWGRGGGWPGGPGLARGGTAPAGSGVGRARQARIAPPAHDPSGPTGAGPCVYWSVTRFLPRGRSAGLACRASTSRELAVRAPGRLVGGGLRQYGGGVAGGRLLAARLSRRGDSNRAPRSRRKLQLPGAGTIRLIDSDRYGVVQPIIVAGTAQLRAKKTSRLGQTGRLVQITGREWERWSDSWFDVAL